MIPIRQYYTEEVKKAHWKRVESILSDKEQRRINRLIKTDDRFKHFNNVKGLITASFEDLQKSYSLLLRNNKVSTDISFLKDRYTNVFAKGRKFHISLVDDLGIKTCPYCNRGYIYSTRRGVGKSEPKNTCQLDHFFDKVKYPYFALSLFNLIPVCSSCNHSKHTKDFNKSPFEIADVDECFKFRLDYAAADYTKPEAFKVTLEVRDKEFCKQEETLGLTKLYEKHNDIGHELFLKQHIYSEDRIRELCESFPELFTSPNEVRQLVIGNYIDKKDVGKRPLAKMTRDIMKQLKFIEE